MMFLIFKDDLKMYPPILSVMDVLLNEGHELTFIGWCSDAEIIKKYKEQGIVFHLIENNVNSMLVKKFINFIIFRRRVKRLVKKYYHTKEDKIWIFGMESYWILYKLAKKYSVILYLFEFPLLKVGLKYRLLSPAIQYPDYINDAYKTVACEYNRAHLTKSIFGLDKLPAIIPNKPDIQDFSSNDMLSSSLLSRLKNKKIILYQGIFNYPERRLDEICKSIDFLNDEFVLCIMGPDDENRKRLHSLYSSDRILFLPYLPPPQHLQITRLATIGVLVYFSTPGRVDQCINTLYCAPNKLYEYSAFGIPMISNDVPALSYAFELHQAGLCVKNFTPKSIAGEILKIMENYSMYSLGSSDLYSSTNIKETIKELNK